MSRKKFNLTLLSIFLLIVCLLLTSCFEGPTPEDKQKMKNLERTYKKAFQERVKAQYGENAKVKNIRAETIEYQNTVWPIFYTAAGDNLLGRITIGNESFDAIYVVDDDTILSQRNIKKIDESAHDKFNSMGLNVLKLSMDYNFDGTVWLPDEITDFSTLLSHKYTMTVNAYVDNDLSKLSPKDFKWLASLWNEYNESFTGSVTIIQINDVSKLDESNSWDINPFTFSDPSPTTYSHEKKEDVSIFEYYDLESSLYLSGQENSFKFYFQDKNGNEKEEYIEYSEL